MHNLYKQKPWGGDVQTSSLILTPTFWKGSNFTKLFSTLWNLTKDFIRRSPCFLRATETNGTSALFAARDHGKEAWQDKNSDVMQKVIAFPPPIYIYNRCAAWFISLFRYAKYYDLYTIDPHAKNSKVLLYFYTVFLFETLKRLSVERVVYFRWVQVPS